MRIFFIGDIYGQPGRRVVREHLADIVASRGVDLVVANGENAAGGFGITPALVEEILGYGIAVLTSGNHIWDKRELLPYWKLHGGDARHPVRRLLRPGNFGPELPGAGLFAGETAQGEPYAVVNVQG